MRYIRSQPNMYTQGESSGTLYNTQIPQQIRPQNALIYASQPQNSIQILNPVQIKSVEQNSSSNSENQWQKVSRKGHRNLDGQEILNAKKQRYWFGGTITTTNRSSTLSEENIEEEAKQSSEPKTPPNCIAGVKYIKPLIELLN